jgi:DNA-directed RNA polymerase subunit K/omega
VQSLVVRDSSGKIIDPLHNTTPILTKYEKTKIIGFRVSHLNDGDSSYINDETLLAEMTPENIALMELELKLLPYIIRRPLPGGKFEYWNLRDLEII